MPILAADALALLSAAHVGDRLAHAYLITGPEGSGKRELVSAVTALLLGGEREPFKHADAHVLEPESKSRKISTDKIRELERALQMRSARGGKKVAVLFDADRLQEQAANAFLKTLEEPPAHSHLFLVSSLPDQLLETILSRCIEIPIQPEEKRGATELQTAMLRTLSEFSAREKPELPHIFRLVRSFHDLLAQARSVIEEKCEAALKKEAPLYKQVDNKDALEDREEYYKALTQSRYIAERSRLLAILEEWWADVLRQQVCPPSSASPPQLDHPAFAHDTAALAARYTAAELLRKTAALVRLRQNLGRTVQEQLAIEVGFLNAFA